MIKGIPLGNERQFGDYTPGRFMWKFQDVKQLTEPIPYRGQQGIFEIPELIINNQ